MTRWILSGATALWLGAVPFADARAEKTTVLDESRFDHAVAVHDVEVTEGQVHGVVENRTEHRVRDVQLLIRRDYRWPNEYRPGDDNPSRVEIHTCL